MLRQTLGGDEPHPIDKRQRHSHNESARFPTLARRNPQRNADQSQQETGRRQRQPVVQLNAGLKDAIGIELLIAISLPIQRDGIHFGIALPVNVAGLGGF